MLHFLPLLHVCSLPQALSLLLRMSQKVGSCRLHWLTVCLNTTALALVSKVTTDFNEREREKERRSEGERGSGRGRGRGRGRGEGRERAREQGDDETSMARPFHGKTTYRASPVCAGGLRFLPALGDSEARPMRSDAERLAGNFRQH